MPHIIIEHSTDIANSGEFLSQIQKILASVKDGNFSVDACKARAISFGQYLVGDKSENESSFFHITVKILSGRSLAVKQEAAQKIMTAGQEFLKSQKLKSRTDLSVDIVDMERETYQKISI